MIWGSALFLPYGHIVNSSLDWGWGTWTLFGILEGNREWELFTNGTLQYWPFEPVSQNVLLYIPLISIFGALVLQLLVKGRGDVRFAGVIVTMNLILQLVDSVIVANVEVSTRLIPYPLSSITHLFVFLVVYKNYDTIVSQSERAKSIVVSPTTFESEVKVLRGAEFVGNRLRYKVKVQNDSRYIITDVTVSLISYPKDSLKIDGDITKIISKIESNGFRSPTFDFLPTADCVKGDVTAAVSFVDPEGQAHSVTTEPYTIRAVCDLLQTEVIEAKEFELKLSELEHGETTLRIEDWTPEVMYTKTLQILESSNFFEVSSESNEFEEHVESRITGWARGKYTGKNIGIEVIITGRPRLLGASCKVQVSGEDQAMIMPAMDEISQKLGAWLCPMCGGNLPVQMVNELKAGKSIACPFCGVTVDR
jgi:hypothetical protein